jgi:hypothetical protein
VKAGRAILMLALLVAIPVVAQSSPSYAPTQLDQLVARVALYPDQLLAQLLAAATFPDQIPDAARWADQHHDLAGQALADAMQAHQLPWDPRVQALLPFPSLLGMMNSDISWTTNLGKAFLAQQQAVMDAVQRQRRRAIDFGYLRSNDQIAVGSEPYITVMPADTAVIVVPLYNPGIVFLAPRPGSAVADAITFRAGVTIGGFLPFGWNLKKFEVLGGFFRPWGWGSSGIDWSARTVIINYAPWQPPG